MIEKRFGLIGSGLVAIALAFGGCAGRPRVSYPVADRIKDMAAASYCDPGQIYPKGYCPDAQAYPLVSVSFRKP